MCEAGDGKFTDHSLGGATPEGIAERASEIRAQAEFLAFVLHHRLPGAPRAEQFISPQLVEVTQVGTQV